ncbi:MAG: preprotein translocase subunit SecE [Victivallaceae bacterium]|nr:preprotein translocase subunit SecE [Victivallaceae bacterium]
MSVNKKSGSGSRVVAGFDLVTGKVRSFMTDTIVEMRRCTWPSRHQLWESTLLVVVAIVVLASFVAGVDEIARRAIELITVGKM